ncbi:MAG: beta-ketoacyl-ACP synthase II [Solirubrobacteraceae bacterium]
MSENGSGPARRVVVTGMGAVSPLGVGVGATWSGLLAGHNGVERISRFDPSPFASQMAGEVKGFDPQAFMERKHALHTARFTQFALFAAKEALDASELAITDANRHEIGVIVGSGIGGLPVTEEAHLTLLERGPRRLSPFSSPMILIDIAAGEISIMLGAGGPNFALVSACASGGHAIGEAAEIIRRGDAVAMLAGSAEATITPLAVGTFAAMRALSQRNDDPEHASRPFDRDRDGFVIAEGSAVLVLEELAHARRRDAPILAELVGYAATADAHHLTAPDPKGGGAYRAMARALERARAGADEIDYINAHGTSTQLNDAVETLAIKKLLGDRATRVPVSSVKSMIGHSLGAAGALEAVVSVQAIQAGCIPPTINVENPDPDCDLDYVPNRARPARVEVALSNSFGFGGHNACLVLQRPGRNGHPPHTDDRSLA